MRDIRELMKLTGLTLKDADQWCIIKSPRYGEINGIPSLRGQLAAHNGSLGILLRHSGPVLVHTPWFIPDHEQHKEKPLTIHERVCAKVFNQYSIDL